MPDALSMVSVGAGNMAFHLVPALKDIGCNILQVYSRQISNARHLADRTDSEAVNTFNLIRPDADLYLIMVPDDEINTVVDMLPKLENDAVVAHTAGAVPINILSKASTDFGSFYPLQSFKKNRETDISATPFLVNGSTDRSLRLLRSLARNLSPRVRICNDEDRLHYHMAAVFLNNFINHLACISDEILSQRALDHTVLSEIARATFKKIEDMDPCEIQTGPAIRNDVKLERKHLALLKDHPEWMAIYKSISQSIKKKYNEDS